MVELVGFFRVIKIVTVSSVFMVVKVSNAIRLFMFMSVVIGLRV